MPAPTNRIAGQEKPVTGSRTSTWIAALLAAVVLVVAAMALWQLQDAGASGRNVTEGTLGPGQHLVLKDGTILRFVGLVSDSRCPADAICIHAGEAVVAFELTPAGGSAIVFEVAFQGDTAVTLVGGYSVSVSAVWPYPLASAPADAADYTVEVNIEAA
jgi:hypothetical protein